LSFEFDINLGKLIGKKDTTSLYACAINKLAYLMPTQYQRRYGWACMETLCDETYS
jgi:hypothetical protein